MKWRHGETISLNWGDPEGKQEIFPDKRWQNNAAIKKANILNTHSPASSFTLKKKKYKIRHSLFLFLSPNNFIQIHELILVLSSSHLKSRME